MSQSSSTQTRKPWREVRLSKDYVYLDGYEGLQANFIDQKRFRPFPSTKVFIEDKLLVQTNSLACWGDEPPEGVPLVGLFGDSVVQGLQNGFAAFVDLPGYAVINGGIEGATIDLIVDHALRVHEQAPMACAAVHSGWHNLLYSETSFLYWEKQFDRLSHLPMVAHFRLTADLHDDAIAKGYESYYRPRNPPDQGYHETFFSESAKRLAEFKAAIQKKNRWLETYCQARGRLLIDLDPVMAPKSAAEVSTHFFDAIHPRITSYPVVGKAIGDALRGHLPQATAAAAPAAAPAAPARSTAAVAEDRGSNYPLW